MSKQICCEDTMDLVATYDDPNKTIHAFNLHFCSSCGKIRKEDVWENAGILDVDVFNNISSAQRRAKDK